MAERLIRIETSNDGAKSYLSKNTTLLFVFSPVDPTKLLENQKPVAWKTLGVAGGGHQVNLIDYSARVGISVLSEQVGNQVFGGQDQEFKLGEMRNVTGTKAAYNWGKATAIDSKTPDGQGLMQAYNKTDSVLTLYVGLYKGDSKDLEPALLFEKIPVDQAATIELTPMLRVYSTADYKETQILKGAIQGYLGEWNLAKLKGVKDGPTKFTLWEDAHNGNKLHLDSDMDTIAGVRTVDA